jgi:hypothetical protein
MRETQADGGKGVANIDFNALWDRAYAPMIEDLGYEPARADDPDVKSRLAVGLRP